MADEQTDNADNAGDAGGTGGTGETVARERLIGVLKEVYDPEIPVNVWDLGLIQRLEAKPGGRVEVDFILTNPACPLADELGASIRAALERVPGVVETDVRVVYEPVWSRERLTEDGRAMASMLGL